MASKVDELVAQLLDDCSLVPKVYACHSEAVCCNREVASLLRVRYSFLKELPYMLIQARERHIAKACIDMYDAATGAKHHRVSHKLLSPTGAFREHLQAPSQCLALPPTPPLGK